MCKQQKLFVYYVKCKRKKNNFVNENGKLNLFFLIFFCFFSLSECQLLASATLLTQVCRLPDILTCFSLVLMNLNPREPKHQPPYLTLLCKYRYLCVADRQHLTSCHSAIYILSSFNIPYRWLAFLTLDCP